LGVKQKSFVLNHNERMQNAIENLLAKYFSESVTESELTVIEAYKAANPSDFAAFENAWKNCRKEMFLDSVVLELDKNTPFYLPKQTTPHKTNKFLKLSGIAASLTLIAMITYFIINKSGSPQYAMMHEIRTEIGQTKNITLPDGSSAVLNGGSYLRYPVQFENKERNLFIEGEVYFNVAKNNRKPFLVETEKVTVKVHGTGFVFKAYPEDATYEVSVKEGKVTFFTNENSAERINLSTLQKGIFFKSTGKISKTVAQAADFAWLDKTLIFDNTPLSEAIKQIERLYGINFKKDDLDLSNCNISASFKDESLQEVLESIGLISDLTFTESDGVVLVEGDACK